MGYLFLAIALLAGSAKGFCGKKVSQFTKTYADASLVNCLRMVFCAVIGAAVAVAGGGDLFSTFDGRVILISLLSGISTAAFVIFWLISVKTGAYVMLDVFLMLGAGVTVTLCFAFLNEPIKLTHGIGFVILVIAAYIMFSYNGTLKGKMSPLKLALLIGCGIANGLTDFSQKLFTGTIEGGNVAEFSFYTYVFAAVTLLAALIFFKLKERYSESPEPSSIGKNIKTVLPYIALLSAFLFVNSYFKTLASRYLDSAVLYPLSQGAALVLSMLMAAIFFKEKITPRCVVGVVLAFAAMIIINVL